MKNTKKILAVLIAAMMVLAMGAMAFAAEEPSGSEPETYTITISCDEAGHTYTAYQIFAGDLNGSVLSNIVWGSDIEDGDDFIAALQADTVFGEDDENDFADCDSATDVAEVLSTYSDNDDVAKLQEFAAVALDNMAENAGALDDDGTTNGDQTDDYIIEDLKAGYYLVTDELDDGTEGLAESALILKLVKTVTISPKANGNPTFDKVIDDDDYYTTDKKVGDDVDYSLVATLPAAATYSKYESYKLYFEDTLDDGLTLDTTSIKVYCGDDEITDYVTIDTNTDQVLKVTIDDTKDDDIDAAAEAVIKVCYTAQINENAEADGSENSNTATLTYSHDPRNSDEYSTLPEKTVTSWTFNFQLTKTFEGGEPQTAKFTLYACDNADDASDSNKIEEKTLTTTATVDEATATWEGLADGTYTLIETSTPDGFNTADPVTFTITTTIGSDGTRTEITSTNDAVDTDEDTGIVSTSIENKEGSILPSTGGIGTTIFYIVGSFLVIGAVIVLVSKRRMSEKA